MVSGLWGGLDNLGAAGCQAGWLWELCESPEVLRACLQERLRRFWMLCESPEVLQAGLQMCGVVVRASEHPES